MASPRTGYYHRSFDHGWSEGPHGVDYSQEALFEEQGVNAKSIGGNGDIYSRRYCPSCRRKWHKSAEDPDRCSNCFSVLHRKHDNVIMDDQIDEKLRGQILPAYCYETNSTEGNAEYDTGDGARHKRRGHGVETLSRLARMVGKAHREKHGLGETAEPKKLRPQVSEFDEVDVVVDDIVEAEYELMGIFE